MLVKSKFGNLIYLQSPVSRHYNITDRARQEFERLPLSLVVGGHDIKRKELERKPRMSSMDMLLIELDSLPSTGPEHMRYHNE